MLWAIKTEIACKHCCKTTQRWWLSRVYLRNFLVSTPRLVPIKPTELNHCFVYLLRPFLCSHSDTVNAVRCTDICCKHIMTTCVIFFGNQTFIFLGTVASYHTLTKICTLWNPQGPKPPTLNNNQATLKKEVSKGLMGTESFLCLGTLKEFFSIIFHLGTLNSYSWYKISFPSQIRAADEKASLSVQPVDLHGYKSACTHVTCGIYLEKTNS